MCTARPWHDSNDGMAADVEIMTLIAETFADLLRSPVTDAKNRTDLHALIT